MFLPVRTESFASEAQRKLAVLTTNADVLAGRCLAAYCYVFGDMRSIAPFPSLSPTDSDCGTERSEARAGGQRSRVHAQSSEVKRSEPDGVRPVWRRAVCYLQQSKAAAKNHSLPAKDSILTSQKIN